jgi:hypothetical protein
MIKTASERTVVDSPAGPQMMYNLEQAVPLQLLAAALCTVNVSNLCFRRHSKVDTVANDLVIVFAAQCRTAHHGRKK